MSKAYQWQRVTGEISVTVAIYLNHQIQHLYTKDTKDVNCRYSLSASGTSPLHVQCTNVNG